MINNNNVSAGEALINREIKEMAYLRWVLKEKKPCPKCRGRGWDKAIVVDKNHEDDPSCEWKPGEEVRRFCYECDGLGVEWR